MNDYADPSSTGEEMIPAAELALLTSLAYVVYTFAGYPALIWTLARARPWPVRRSDHLPTVAIVVVALNESARIRSKIDNCLSQSYPAHLLRVVIASDGSTDSTAPIVGAYADSRVTLLAYPERRGKAACLNDAIDTCEQEILVLTDARQRLDPGAVRSLVANFADPHVGAVSGELVFEEDDGEFAAGMDAYWRYEKFIRRSEGAFHSVVGVTGAIYAIRRREYERIPPETLIDDVLIPMNVVLKGRRVVFEEGALAYDRPSREVGQEKARKVRTLAGNFQLLVSHPRFLNPFRNPLFLQLISHKVARLFAPYALLLLLGCSIVLRGSSFAYDVLLSMQALGYGSVALGTVWPWLGRTRVVRLMTAFLVLNGFAVLGLGHYLLRRHTDLWKANRPEPGEMQRMRRRR
jgi:cellulose synthase/poly-beta-1,6-N-acetylglucosamine synthase-like glycosyltransferase